MKPHAVRCVDCDTVFWSERSGPKCPRCGVGLVVHLVFDCPCDPDGCVHAGPPNGLCVLCGRRVTSSGVDDMDHLQKLIAERSIPT